MSKVKVEAYTDGACRGNPGPGGWGALLRFAGSEKILELKGAEINTTNNRMELTAAIEALAVLEESVEVDLTTDSQYVKNGITRWVSGWKKKGWITSSKKPVKNKDLWLKLDALVAQHQVQWHWVKGHSGHPDNERVDALANQAIDAL